MTDCSIDTEPSLEFRKKTRRVLAFCKTKFSMCTLPKSSSSPSITLLPIWWMGRHIQNCKKASTWFIEWSIKTHSSPKADPPLSRNYVRILIVSPYLHSLENCWVMLSWDAPLGDLWSHGRLWNIHGQHYVNLIGKQVVGANKYRNLEYVEYLKIYWGIFDHELQRSAKRRGCLLSYSQAEPGRELTQPSPRLLAEPCKACRNVYGQ